MDGGRRVEMDREGCLEYHSTPFPYVHVTTPGVRWCNRLDSVWIRKGTHVSRHPESGTLPRPKDKVKKREDLGVLRPEPGLRSQNP